MKRTLMTAFQAAILAFLTIAGAYASSTGSQKACSASSFAQQCGSGGITTAARKGRIGVKSAL